jgi:hypothetical protein
MQTIRFVVIAGWPASSVGFEVVCSFVTLHEVRYEYNNNCHNMEVRPLWMYVHIDVVMVERVRRVMAKMDCKATGGGSQ